MTLFLLLSASLFDLLSFVSKSSLMFKRCISESCGYSIACRGVHINRVVMRVRVYYRELWRVTVVTCSLFHQMCHHLFTHALRCWQVLLLSLFLFISHLWLPSIHPLSLPTCLCRILKTRAKNKSRKRPGPFFLMGKKKDTA